MTADDVRNLLSRACDQAGGIRSWAREHGLSAAYVSDVLAKRREPGPSICEAFGLQAECKITYRAAKQ
jgi:hypothetical protein